MVIGYQPDSIRIRDKLLYSHKQFTLNNNNNEMLFSSVWLLYHGHFDLGGQTVNTPLTDNDIDRLINVVTNLISILLMCILM